MNKIPVLTSPLRNLLEQYIEYKRMCGYKSPTITEDIRQFDVFVTKSPVATNQLTKELSLSYITHRPGEKKSTQAHRVSTLRCLGKYLVRCGIDAYVLPNGTLSIARYDFVPCVFSTDEIARFMRAVDSLPHRANSPNRHIIMPMMFRLIYSCGLRLSEASGLLLEDVDLQTGVLFIRGAKFNKDRYVPMSQSILQRCRDYSIQMNKAGNGKTPFFPSPSGGFYRNSSVGEIFHQCRAMAGIPHTDDGPTIHSLRHSWAVHNLMRWGAENRDVNVLLPYLSAYMGHENLLGSERYLRMTMEMFPEIKSKISTGCAWIMPEVDCNED